MSSDTLTVFWNSVSATPLTWLGATLFAYLAARRLYAACGSHPFVNPVAVSIALLIVLLVASGTRYETYFDGAGLLHFLLGPAVVALAVPVYRSLDRLRAAWLPMSAAIVVGGCVAAASALLLASLLDASAQTALSLAPKSITAPVAMSVSERIGGLPPLTASLAVLTGIVGATLGTRVLDSLGIHEDCVRGVALGTTSHGIGTARALQLGAESGAFAGLAMAVSAFVSSIVVPWVVPMLGFGG